MEFRFYGSIAIWLLFWVVAWQVFYGPMAKRNINYVDSFILTSVYFLLLATLIVVLFRSTFAVVGVHPTPAPFIALLSMFLIQVAVYHLARIHLKRPVRFILENPREMFLSVDWRYLVSKTFEVLFQQAMIVLLVLILWRQTRNMGATIIAFAIVFALAHLPLFRLAGGQVGLFARIYVISAMASAMVFPIIILKVDLGFVYTYVMHSVFFTILALWFWVKHTRSDAS